jgi:cytochrome b561
MTRSLSHDNASAAARLPAGERYHGSTIFFHWTIAGLVVLAYLAMDVRGPKGTLSRVLWSDTHYWAGTLVLMLAILRFLTKWRARRPLPLPVPFPQAVLATAVHLMLAVFIITQPLLGMLMVNLGGHPVVLAGPNWAFTLVAPDPHLRAIVHTVHVTLAKAFYFVIGLHAFAALWHHFIKRDVTLRRML